MKIIKKIIINYLQKENKELKKILSEIMKGNEICFLDIGALGGIPNRWIFVEKYINKILVEPNESSAKKLIQEGNDVIDKVLYSKENTKLDFYNTKKETCSSFLKPNKDHLKKFNDYDRFSIEKVSNCLTSTLDLELKNKNNKPDFIKIDTEGSELSILDGSKETLKNVLGIEIEASFFNIRENQPRFDEVIKYLSKNNFEFVDFLTLIRWERNNFRFTGQPQLTDLLFLISPDKIIKDYNLDRISDTNVIKYILILIVYLRVDYLFLLSRDVKIKNTIKSIDEIYKIVERKVKKINKIENIAYMLKNKIYNTI